MPNLSPTPRLTLDPPAPAALADIDVPAAILDERGVVLAINAAWADHGDHFPLPGQPYVARLRALAPAGCEAVEAIADTLSHAPRFGADVTEQTIECHESDSEHWFSVIISTVRLRGRRVWLVLHQDATALRQAERRHRLTQRLATVQAIPQEAEQRAWRIAVEVGDVLRASAVVEWERSRTGGLRARPVHATRLSAQVINIVHPREMLKLMAARAPLWIDLPDGVPCLAVPLVSNERVLLFHFPHGPRFDAETLRLVVRAFRPERVPGAPPRATRARSPRQARRDAIRDDVSRSASLAQLERAHIERTLVLCAHNLVHTAQALGIARSTLYARIRDYAITVPTRGE